MHIVKRGKAVGGFNVIRKGGGVRRMMRDATEGLGRAQTTEFYRDTNVSHPFKSFGTGNIRTMQAVKVKSSRPKKYISLNV
ncbi:MAG: hypothetical protein ACRCZ2_07525 [Fusobacteriaceae bacterium]